MNEEPKIKNKSQEDNDDVQNELRDYQSIEVDSPEELQKLLDQLAGSGNNDAGKGKKKIGIVNRLFPNIFVNLLFYIIFTIAVTLAIEGYLNIFKYDHFYELLLFVIVFATIDTLGRDLLYSKIPFIVLTSFGSVTLLLTIVASLGTSFLIPNFTIINFGIYALYIVLLLILRFIVTMYFSKLLFFRRKNKKKGK